MTQTAWMSVGERSAEPSGNGNGNGNGNSDNGDAVRRPVVTEGVGHAVVDGEHETLCGLQIDNDYREPWPGREPVCQTCVHRERASALMLTQF